MASKAVVVARKAATSLRRRMEDERLQVAAGAGGGGFVASFVDKDGIRHLGETPFNMNQAVGGGLLLLALFVKKLPFRAAAGGLGAGMMGAGNYVMGLELQGVTSLQLSPPES